MDRFIRSTNRFGVPERYLDKLTRILYRSPKEGSLSLDSTVMSSKLRDYVYGNKTVIR